MLKFLTQNSNKKFYAFAFDCNAEYAEVNLCFNTEADFSTTLKRYQQGEFGHSYQTLEQIKDLKYNTGDWAYQCFSTIHLLNADELKTIFESFPGDDYQFWKIFREELMTLFALTLLDFRKTALYQKIAKTSDFRSLCIDHDEDIEDAELRLNNYLY